MADTIKNISAPTIKKIKGDYHVGDIFHTINNYSSKKRKIQFEPANAGPDLFNDYLRPTFMDELLAKAKAEQLLLVGGNNELNKGQLLQYVALHLKTDGFDVKECTEFDDFHSLSAAIHDESKNSIFILYNLTAESISYRFNELKALIRKKEHIILGSTDHPYDTWHFQEGNQNPSWFEIPASEYIYSAETLKCYLDAALKKKNITLPQPAVEITRQLSKMEQVDMFLDRILKSETPDDANSVLEIVQHCLQADQSQLEPRFYSMTNNERLLVIGISLFDGAYEGQVFAGYERILNSSWKQRNKNLQSIDYEDLISLRAWFKIEGKVIQGICENQRRKIIQMAWRTHRRYLLSALTEILAIIFDSATLTVADADLFASADHCIRIRNVLSETLSDIGLQSFDDVHLPFLQLASSENMYVQMTTAAAISRWKLFEEEKIYSVLGMWQQDTAARLLNGANMRRAGQQDDHELISNLRGAIALSLCFLAYYDKPNQMSPKISSLLLEFLHNNEGAIVERMQYAVEHISARHPVSMKGHLQEHFLRYTYYIGPVSTGLAAAYDNGLMHEVKEIIREWLNYAGTLPDHPEDRDSFGHRESILSTVIYTLKQISYTVENRFITIGDAYSILEDLRKTNHNNYIRRFALEAIVELIEVMFYSDEKTPIRLIRTLMPPKEKPS